MQVELIINVDRCSDKWSKLIEKISMSNRPKKIDETLVSESHDEATTPYLPSVID